MVLMVKTSYHKTISDLRKSLARLERVVGKEFVDTEMMEQEKDRTELSSELSDSLKANEIFNNINLKTKNKEAKENE